MFLILLQAFSFGGMLLDVIIVVVIAREGVMLKGYNNIFIDYWSEGIKYWKNYMLFVLCGQIDC